MQKPPTRRPRLHDRAVSLRCAGHREFAQLHSYLRRLVVMMRLHHVQLAMPRGHESQARAFFVDVLGMTEVDKPPILAGRGGAWFRAEQVELHLGVDDDFHPARKGHPAILVDQLDDIVTRLTRAGQTVTPDDAFPGYHRVYAHDPFGNRLEFLQQR